MKPHFHRIHLQVRAAVVALCLLATALPAYISAQHAEWHAPSMHDDDPVNPVTHARMGTEPALDAGIALAPPTNDNCGSAINLVAGAPCTPGTTLDASTQLLESLCLLPGLGILGQSVWYSFIATNDSMVVSYVQTNVTNCNSVFAIYGPFTPGNGCLPNLLSLQLCQNMGLIDPGLHYLCTGLNLGQRYLLQVQGNNCGGPNSRTANFCVSLDNPIRASRPATAAKIDSCNFANTANNGLGQWNAGTSAGSNNLDNNNATTVAGASEAGDDVTFVINNVAWMYFCNGNPTSCQWNINLGSINSCLLPAPNNGLQTAVFTGTPSALIPIAAGPNRIPPGTAWNSGNFSIAAGGCAYVMIDGFAGDECNFSITVDRVNCPCLLPITLADFAATHEEAHIRIAWKMAEEDGVRSYRIDRSADGRDFTALGTVDVQLPGMGGEYSLRDHAPLPGWNMYRLTALERDGAEQHLSTTSIFRTGTGAAPTPRLSQSGSNLFLRLPDDARAELHLSLIDLQGRTHYQADHACPAAGEALCIPADRLGTGIYLIKVAQGGRHWAQKFVIP